MFCVGIHAGGCLAVYIGEASQNNGSSSGDCNKLYPDIQKSCYMSALLPTFVQVMCHTAVVFGNVVMQKKVKKHEV